MKRYHVKLKGLTPYMQHRMDDVSLSEWERLRGPIMERPEVSQTDLANAEFRAFRTPDGHYYMPADHIRGALINAGSYSKAKVGGRGKSMKSIVAAMFMVTPEQIPLPAYDQIDKRSVVNKAAKARVMSVRPKWSAGWEVEFTLEISNDTLTDSTVKQILKDAGDYVGIGSFRPTNNGMFGRFETVEFRLLPAAATASSL